MKTYLFITASLLVQFLAGQDTLKNLDQFRDRVNRADLILEGRVATQHCFRARGLIWTSNYIVPLKWFKGDFMDTIEMITLGGMIGDEAMDVSDAWPFYPKSDYFFFFKKENDSYENIKRTTYFPLNVENSAILISDNLQGGAEEWRGRAYSDLVNEIYKPVAQLVGSDYKVLGKNRREEAMERQEKADSIYQGKRMDIFENRAVDYDLQNAKTYRHILPANHMEYVLEFDVRIHRLGADKNREEKLVSSAVYIQYDTSVLGPDLIKRGLVTVEFPNELKVRGYNFTAEDTSPGMMKFIATTSINDTSAIYPLERISLAIAHCRVASKDVSVDFHQLYFNFNRQLMLGATSFYDSIGKAARPYKYMTLATSLYIP